MSRPDFLYKCTACTEPIPATKPRLSCNACTPRLTLCANCYVVQDYPSQHEHNESHAISLHRHSGFLLVPPPPPPRAPAQQQPVRSLSSYGPPRRRPISTMTPAYSDVPPRKPPRPRNVETRGEGENGEGVPVARVKRVDSQQQSPHQQSPERRVPEQQVYEQQVSEPRATEQRVSEQRAPEPTQTVPEYPPESPTAGWTSLLNEDMKPSLSFVRLMEELFYHLDTQRTGFLTPEVYARYIEACGAPENHNIWKHALTTSNQNHDIADRELTDHFTAYSIDFSLAPRTPTSTSTTNPFSLLPSSISQFIPKVSVSGGQKPLLSLQGFKSLAHISILLSPSSAWGQLNRVMRTFRIPVWTEWGDLPRDVLPLAPWQPEVERVRILLEGARMNAEAEVDAVHARLKMEQRGRQAALDLLDDRVWVYR